ncbi:sensor histidine kinase [Nocardioides lijunqiniae]|uniref:sensor histidine kinase n=1 Tax=Nocardioides lijunqiniae TaxID=2760832 RepID=UPI0018782B52|nr:HAMP domain-containing sensor histidine kinase [Nocardioides lijunqiniae]
MTTGGAGTRWIAHGPTRYPRQVWTARASALVLVMVVAPLVGTLLITPELRSIGGLATVTQLLVYPTVMGASILLYVQYRLTDSNVVGWLALCLTEYSVQGAALAGLRASEPDAFFNRAGWTLIIDFPAALLILGCLRLSDRVRHAADPLAVGLLLGLLVAGVNLGVNRFGGELLTTDPAAVAAQVALVVVGCGIARAAYLLDGLPAWFSARLGAGTIALVVNRAVSTQDAVGALGETVAIVTGIVGVLLMVNAAGAGLRHAVQQQHLSLLALTDQVAVMQADERDVRARLHEITNSLAGIAVASSLLHQQDEVPAAKRRQLERMLDSEAGRLSRLLAGKGNDALSEPSPRAQGTSEARQSLVDLDEVIWPLVTAQEALGRPVDWHPTGHRGLGDPDAVAEVVNILLDNAARHAPGSHSVVEVTRHGDTVEVIVRDDGPGIPAEVRHHLFEWGSRGPHSEGQGIGLHLAHRLMAATGSSLRLETQDVGNTFVISLSAAEETTTCTPSERRDPTRVSSSSRTTCSSPSHSSSP